MQPFFKILTAFFCNNWSPKIVVNQFIVMFIFFKYWFLCDYDVTTFWEMSRFYFIPFVKSAFVVYFASSRRIQCDYHPASSTKNRFQTYLSLFLRFLFHLRIRAENATYSRQQLGIPKRIHENPMSNFRVRSPG